MMDGYLERGGNFIDTANGYTDGDSERIVGNWIKSKGAEFRKRIIVATKLFFTQGPSPNEKGLSRKHILHAVEDSLERLQLKYIDVLFLHCYDPSVKFKEVFSTLNTLVKQGKILYIGVSNFTASQLQKAVDLCREKDWERISVLQTQWHLLCRETEWELIPLCEKEGKQYFFLTQSLKTHFFSKFPSLCTLINFLCFLGVAVHVWSPLAGGWLTGRYTRESKAPEEDSRLEWIARLNFSFSSWDTLANEHTWKIVDTLFELSKKHNATPAQVAINWLHGKGRLLKTSVIPILGASKISQLEDNLKACDWSLSDEDVQLLDQVSAKPLPYPFNFQFMFRNFTK